MQPPEPFVSTPPATSAPTAPTSLTPLGAALEPTFILRPSIVERLDWRAIFGNDAPVELELGAGDGSFLIRYATRHPERNFLGVERLLGRLRKIDRKSQRAGLTNVRALRLEARYVMRWMVPPGSLRALHVYFPDPWPKRRHWKRRLINLEFTALVAQALAPEGVAYVRTDDLAYFTQMTEVFDANPDFTLHEAPSELLGVVTDFEADFNQSGTPTRQAAWRRK